MLSTKARVEPLSDGTGGPWDISAADATLDLLVDAGQDLHKEDPADPAAETVSGIISVAVAGGTFADTSAATAAEIVARLNGDSALAGRATPYLEGGEVVIRNRNLRAGAK